MTEPTNNDYLSDIANVQRDSGKTNNELLEIIANNGGGGGGGGGSTKSQIISANGDFAADVNVIATVGGDTFNLPPANQDGKVIDIYNMSGFPITLRGDWAAGGQGTDITLDNPNITMIRLACIDLTDIGQPGELGWLISYAGM